MDSCEGVFFKYKEPRREMRTRNTMETKHTEAAPLSVGLS